MIQRERERDRDREREREREGFIAPQGIIALLDSFSARARSALCNAIRRRKRVIRVIGPP